MTETNDGWEQWDLFGNLAAHDTPDGVVCRCGAVDGEQCRLEDGQSA